MRLQVADAAFLTDVVIETTRDQGRLARDFDENAFRRLYEQWSATQLDTTSVIVVDGVDAGRLRVVRTPESIELAGIQLLPAYQGIGIGRLVLDGLKQEARERRTPIELSVERDNPRAQAFYEREGFTLVTSTESDHVLRWSTGSRARLRRLSRALASAERRRRGCRQAQAAPGALRRLDPSSDEMPVIRPARQSGDRAVISEGATLRSTASPASADGRRAPRRRGVRATSAGPRWRGSPPSRRYGHPIGSTLPTRRAHPAIGEALRSR